MGCVDGLRNGGFDDWDEALPFPPAWEFGDGSLERVDGEEAECPPAVSISAGAPRPDGVVWDLAQTLDSVAVEAGGAAIFVARFRRIAAGFGEARICSNADPAAHCADVAGYTEDGWVTVSSEIRAQDGPLVLHDLFLHSYEVDQEILIDDLHLWICPP